MDISFDPNKRAKTLQERGLDFADAGQVFMGATATQQDQRKDYGEAADRNYAATPAGIVRITQPIIRKKIIRRAVTSSTAPEGR